VRCVCVLFTGAATSILETLFFRCCKDAKKNMRQFYFAAAKVKVS